MESELQNLKLEHEKYQDLIKKEEEKVSDLKENLAKTNLEKDCVEAQKEELKDEIVSPQSKLESVNQAENTEKENDIIEMGEKLQDTFFAQETWSKEENILKEKISSLLRDIEEKKINSEIKLKKMKDQQKDTQEKEKILLEELQSLNQELEKKDNLINELEIKLDLESRAKLDEISKIRVELQEKEKMFEPRDR